MSNRYSFKVGDFNCLAINDGSLIGSASPLFINAPEAELTHALDRHGLQRDHLPSAWTCLLVETPDHLVLVDTGLNNAINIGGGGLFSGLQDAGIAPGDIDTVILTHGHLDHVGGCSNAKGEPSFPNARYMIIQSEWDYWTSPEEKPEQFAGEVIRQRLLPIESQLETIQPDTEIVPGIRAFPAHGHTIGHIALEIESGGDRLLHLVDSVLHPIQIEHPDWVAIFDMFPDQTVITRRELCRLAAEKEAMTLFFHFAPFPGLGYIVEKGNAWEWKHIEDE
ncbi:MAG TPA: MBL fold metallo-hydrolase [Anaerolineales bacterium]|nr:MBL fold metallo-hydrolase [Anaerolineales bacterium]